MLKCSVLGTDYTIEFKTDREDPSLLERNGYMDYSVNKIVIRIVERDNDTLEDLSRWTEDIIKHELIHAFMVESGLKSNISDIHTEDNVDWMASQLDKISSTFMKLKPKIKKETNKLYE